MLKGLSTAAAAVAFAVGGLGACVDAKARFDEFGDRVPIVDASTVDRPNLDIADVNGTFYLALRAVNFNNTIHLGATFTLTVDGPTGTIAATYQPLSSFNEDPPQRRVVGGLLNSAAVAVDETASFAAPVVGTIVGEANPISGSPLGSQVTLRGTILSADLVCGTVTGTVCLGMDAPCDPGVSVEPATFAAVRVPSFTELPALPPTVACPN